MKKYLVGLVIFALTLLTLPNQTSAAGGIYPSGGGTKTVGQNFTVSVVASGATFDSLQGVISVTGPVSILSFSAGSATWLPGKTPANGTQFVGIVSETNSLTVASISLKATAVGSGTVTVSGVRLAHAGNEVGTSGGSAGYTIIKAPNLPGAIKVSSSTHPNPDESYEATTVELSWEKASGVKSFSYLIDQASDTIPASKATSSETSATYSDLAVGAHCFHIKALNAEGWGSTTHFQINIKEPEPKISEELSKPSNIRIEKGDNFINDLDNGTLSGIVISGKTESGFTANIYLSPEPTVPEDRKLSVEADDSGNFRLELDYPIKTGFYKLTVQGQKDKVLTPISDEIKFELTQAKGGNITLLTEKDVSAIGVFDRVKTNYLIIVLTIAAVIASAVLALMIICRKRKENTFNTEGTL